MAVHVVHFEWKHGGNHVLLAGSFSNWLSIPMFRSLSSWTLSLPLLPNSYQIKYIVDGNWYYDYEAETVVDEVGNINNIIRVGCDTNEVPKTPTLVILRGASGSGKTTKALELLEKNGGETFAEADKRMVNDNGEYEFDPKKLSSAHAGCASDVEEAMKRSEIFIVVSNTFTQYWEIYEYVKLSQKYFYDVYFMEPDTPWRYDPQILCEKNAHSVPLATIKNQLENLKRNPTLPTPEMISAVIATGGFRPSIYREGINMTPWKLIYYGINEKTIAPFAEKLKAHLTEEEYENFIRAKCQRDGGPNEKGEYIYHVTLANFHPKDDDVLSADKKMEYFKALKALKTKPKFLGVGKAELNESVSYYVVVDWPDINETRKSFKLSLIDPHVTLGFFPNDVHGISKGLETLIPNSK